MLNKNAYVEMCILDLTKVLMYEVHHDYIKNDYYKGPTPLDTNCQAAWKRFSME